MQLKHQAEAAVKDRKRIDDELYQVKDKLRQILDEKIAIENELNHIERVEESRINDLESKFTVLTEDYIKVVEENKFSKRAE